MCPADVPLVSIVTPSFNQAPFLEATIRSVLAQDYPRVEYTVIDGGSEDGSLAILERYSTRLASWVSEPDRGQSDAINKGLRQAGGEIVAWLNSDDLYMPGTICAAVEALTHHPEAGMVYADGLLIDREGRLLDRHKYGRYSLLDLLCFEVLLQPTVFMRRSVLEAVGYLSDEYDLILDHELWVRIASSYPIVHVQGFWAAERTYPEAKTIASAAAFADEARRLLEWARTRAAFAPVVNDHWDQVEASWECFAARRKIDSRHYGQALRHFARGMRIAPAVVLKYWYKIIQAGMGAVGLEKGFLWYRRARRRLQHADARLVWSGDGFALVEGGR